MYREKDKPIHVKTLTVSTNDFIFIGICTKPYLDKTLCHTNITCIKNNYILLESWELEHASSGFIF